MGKTEIKVGTTRKIQTAPFEGLDIAIEITEIIEWKDEAERDKKTDKVIKHLISDFKKAYESVIKTIGVERSLGIATLTKEDGSVHIANVSEDNNDDEIDIFGD